MSNIPFLDLKAEFHEQKAEIMAAVEEALEYFSEAEAVMKQPGVVRPARGKAAVA